MNAILLRAVALRADSRYTEATAILLDLFKQNPRDPQVNYELACTYDPQGMEQEAIPFYERALEYGLSGDDLRGCLLGLGSSYRCQARYSDAIRVLERGLAAFPDAAEFNIFLALSFYNLGQAREAVSRLLHHVAEFSSHEPTKTYRRAIAYYASQPDPPYES